MSKISLKTPREIAKIRESGRLLALTHEHIQSYIQSGISTLELDKEILNFITKNKAQAAFLNYNGFPGAACISVNDEVIHGIPSKRKIKQGDIVSIDIGVNLDGFISDRAHTYAVGEISIEAQNLLIDCEASLYQVIENIGVNSRIKDIAKIITAYLDPKNYGIVYQYCGHGVGLKVHEAPEIQHNSHHSSGGNMRLKKGMVIAVEPMVNIGTADVILMDDDWTVKTADASLSAHFEHTLAITDAGIEILTKI